MEYLNDIKDNIIRIQNENKLYWYLLIVKLPGHNPETIWSLFNAIEQLRDFSKTCHVKLNEDIVHSGFFVIYNGENTDLALMIFSSEDPNFYKFFNHLDIRPKKIEFGDPLTKITDSNTDGDTTFVEIQNTIKKELIKEYGHDANPYVDHFKTFGKLKKRKRKRIKEKRGQIVIIS